MVPALPRLVRVLICVMLIFAALSRAGVSDRAHTVLCIVAVLATGLFLVHRALCWDWRFSWTPVGPPLAVLLVWSGVTAATGLHPATSLWAMVWFAVHVAVFYLVVHVFRTRDQVRLLLSVILGLALFLSVFGFVKVGGANPFSFWDYPDLGSSRGRFSATFGNANHLVDFLSMSLLAALGWWLSSPKPGYRLFVGVCLVALPAALIATLSRGGYVAAAAGLGLFLVLATRRKGFLTRRDGLILTAFAAVAALATVSSTAVVNQVLTAYDPLETLAARMSAWKATVSMIGDHPWVGTGPGTYSQAFAGYQPPGIGRRFYHAHNDYLQIVADTGLVAVPVMIWLAVAYVKAALSNLATKSRFVYGTTIGSLAATVAMAIHMAVDFPLHIPATSLLFVALAAMATSARTNNNTAHAKRPVKRRPAFQSE